MNLDSQEFRAFEVTEDMSGAAPVYKGGMVRRLVRDLPAGDILVKVAWSSLNYKDALSAHGNKGVTRSFPHTPGIDAAGCVAQSATSAFKPGDPVIVTGHELGMSVPGGFAQYIRVPAHWVVPLPQTLSLKDSMVYGTAGLTAALCVEKLLSNGVRPEQGEVLVTGATGGVGAVATALLSLLGFSVAACTGKPDMTDFLRGLGAHSIVPRAELAEPSPRALLKERWAGAVDVAGGDLLWNIVRSLRYGGSVASCGLVGAPAFGATVFPFILRNVNLLGVDSASTTLETRVRLWEKLAGEWRIPQLKSLSKDITFSELSNELKVIYEGGATGRRVLDVGK